MRTPSLSNILIFGSGHCGTSMVSSFFRKSFHYKGGKANGAGIENPLGFYEDGDVFDLNNRIIAPYVEASNKAFGPNQRGLAPIDPNIEITCTEEQRAEIREFCSHPPFCYKSPALSVTLPLWRPYVGDCIFILMFRHPSETVYSYASAMRDVPENHDLGVSVNRLFDMWRTSYRRIIDYYRKNPSGRWIIVQYERLFDEDYRRAFAAKFNFELDFSTISPDARQTRPWKIEPPPTIAAVYEELLALDNVMPTPATADPPLPNVMILGTGRCGTSMVSSFFRKTAHYKGKKADGAGIANPLGFYEDGDVFNLNDRILRPYVEASNKAFGPNQSGPAPIDPDIEITCTEEQRAEIRYFCRKRPFCYKSPSFGLTLPLWRPYVGECIFICTFRHPSETVYSYASAMRDVPENHGTGTSINRMFEFWRDWYQHIINYHAKDTSGRWIFVQYERLFDEDYRRAFAAKFNFELDFSTISPDARHARPWKVEPPPTTATVYKKLLTLDNVMPTRIGVSIAS